MALISGGSRSMNSLVRGRQEIIRNLNRELSKMEHRTKGGLLQAALLVKRRAVQQTPRDTGHLRASAYTEAAETRQGARGRDRVHGFLRRHRSRNQR